MPDAIDHALLCLHLAENLGPRRIAALIGHFGDPEDALRANARQLRQVEGIGETLANRLARSRDELRCRAEAELAWLDRHQGRLLTCLHADWPTEFEVLPDAPVCLFLRGRLPGRPGIAIVGTRACTPYGMRQAARFAAELARAGLSITSGLARGIDAQAHEAALDAGGHTSAILGSGMARLYPAENEPLAERMVAAGGALLSEHPHDQPPQAGHFPRRNRLVAALSRGTLVIESGARGGSLITVRLAAELGREAWALPGPVDRPASTGCHALIRDGVQLVTDPLEILTDLRWSEGRGPDEAPDDDSRPEPAIATLDEGLRELANCLRGEELTLDEMIERSGQNAATASTGLLQLELLGLVQSLPGGRYTRA